MIQEHKDTSVYEGLIYCNNGILFTFHFSVSYWRIFLCCASGDYILSCGRQVTQVETKKNQSLPFAHLSSLFFCLLTYG